MEREPTKKRPLLFMQVPLSYYRGKTMRKRKNAAKASRLYPPTFSGLQCEANSAKDKSKSIASMNRQIFGLNRIAIRTFDPCDSGDVWFMELPKSMMPHP